MKKSIFLFAATTAMTLFGSCSSDEGDSTRPTITVNGSNNNTITMDYDITKTASFSFNASNDWTITAPSDEMTVSKTSGNSGTNNITIQLLNYNSGNEILEHYFTISSKNSLGTTDVKVTVKQDPVFEVAETQYEANALGDTIYVEFNTDADYREAYIAYDKNSDMAEMCGWTSSGAKSDNSMQICEEKIELQQMESTRAGSKYKYYYKIPIVANTSSKQLSGDFVFFIDNPKDQNDFSECSTWMNVTQLPGSIECSTDTVTNNGKVYTLQSHTKGNGVPFVIMGDGYLDKDMTNGNYEAACEKAMEAVFALEPMKSLREYFDVYEVTAVSLNNVFSSTTKTAFSCQYGSGTEISGTSDKVLAYAQKAVGKSNIDNTTILVILNDDKYAGTTYFQSSTTKEIPSGYSIAYIPMNTETDEQYSFQTILNHEAVGHGFAKLADEYGYQDNGSFTSLSTKEQNEYKNEQAYGMWRNVSVYSDVTKSYWADLAADSKYSSENLGCYEGADTYVKGIYRPTDESIMRDNINGFSAPQRRLIYNRCMRIANGSSWSADYDEFIAFDATARSSSVKTTRALSSAKSLLRHLAKPHLIIK